jgi:hypothetical protein
MRIIKQRQPDKFLRLRSHPFWSLYHLSYLVPADGLNISQNVSHIRQ